MSSYLMRNFTRSAFFRESSNAPFTSTRATGDQDTTYVTEQSILGPDSGGQRTAVFWMVTTDYDDTADQTRGRLVKNSSSCQVRDLYAPCCTPQTHLLSDMMNSNNSLKFFMRVIVFLRFDSIVKPPAVHCPSCHPIPHHMSPDTFFSDSSS